MKFDLFGPEDDWESRSGLAGMLEAEGRLRNLRRVAAPLVALHRDLVSNLEHQRQEYLTAVENDDEAAPYLDGAMHFADEELSVARHETSVLIVGSLVAYGFSFLETTLATAYMIVVESDQKPKVRGAKIDGWLKALDATGFALEWDDLLDELQEWRERRNAYAHELHLGSEYAIAESPENWDIEAFLELLIDAIHSIDDRLTVWDEARKASPDGPPRLRRTDSDPTG